MFGLFKKTELPIKELDAIYFDEANKDDFFNQYFNPRVPVLIKGGAKDWPLMSKWDKDYVIKKAGNYTCTVVSDSRPAASKTSDTLKNYFKKHTNKSTLTLQKYQPEILLPLLKDVPIPSPFFSDENIRRYFFYHANKDGGTLPHKHGDAFNILVSGTKKWAFFDASTKEAPKGDKMVTQFHKSYPSGSEAKDWFEKELAETPKSLGKIQVYECIQEPGDIVYVPAEYSHTVLNLSEVMGVVFERSR